MDYVEAQRTVTRHEELTKSVALFFWAWILVSPQFIHTLHTHSLTLIHSLFQLP